MYVTDKGTNVGLLCSWLVTQWALTVKMTRESPGTDHVGKGEALQWNQQDQNKSRNTGTTHFRPAICRTTKRSNKFFSIFYDTFQQSTGLCWVTGQQSHSIILVMLYIVWCNLCFAFEAENYITLLYITEVFADRLLWVWYALHAYSYKMCEGAWYACSKSSKLPVRALSVYWTLSDGE